jgi:hypothetical protein
MASRSESVFRLGRPFASESIADMAAEDATFAGFCYECLRRHVNSDWGHISTEDKTRNERAIGEGSRILSAYRKRGYPEVWITTEADRSVTRILFPHEYQAESHQGNTHMRERTDVGVDHRRLDVSA